MRPHHQRLGAPLLALLAACASASPAPEAPRLMAEWEPALGTLVAHPFELPEALLVDLAAEAELYVLVRDDHREDAADLLAHLGVDAASFTLVPTETGTPWTRDWGPHQVETADGERALVDHVFRGYPWVPADCDTDDIGYRWGAWAGEDAAVDALAANLGATTVELPAVATGGNLLTDGHGRAFCTAAQLVENAAQEPPIDEATYRALLAEHLGITDLVVLENTEPFGIQHIDCWLKVVDAETLLVKAAPEDHPEFAPIERNVELLRALTTPSGGRYRILRIDCAPFATVERRGRDGGEPRTEVLLPAYTNSLRVNDVVHVPLFDGPADEAALATYRTAYPDCEVRGYAYDDWKHFDALHCRARALHARP